MATDSVFQLITHLCQTMCNDYNRQRVYGPPLGDEAVKKCRNSAFGVLLHTQGQQQDGAQDCVREILFHQFDMRQRARTTLDRDRCDQLEKCIEKLLAENQFFQTDTGQAILTLLLELKNTTQFDAETSMMDFYPFGFYSSMRSVTETNPYICISEEMCSIPRRLDIDVDNQYRQFNPYMPNPLIFISPRDPKYEKLDYFFKFNFEIPSPVRRAQGRQLQVAETVAEEESPEIPRTTDSDPPGPLYLSWNHLGKPRNKVPRERPFATESPEAIYHLTNVLKQKTGEEYSLKVVQESTYLMNLKYLCTGVESDFFQFDAEDVAYSSRESRVTAGNFSPETLREVNRRFIEFGTCFKRLEMATSVIPEKLTMPVEGFVYKTLSLAINKFLFSIRHFIFNGPKNETILEFSLRVRQFGKVIGFFAKLFKIHPENNTVEDMPKGSRLMAYLYEILMDEMNKQDNALSVVTLVRDCCQAYYQLFQQWIFNGILIDPYNELFISYTDQYKLQTKHYFDKSFYLRVGDVPAFLKGYEQDLLLCGKYTMLLREYQPNHRIFSLSQPPKVHVCLSYEAIERVKEVCGKYLREGYESCGGKISVRKIFAERRDRQNELKKTMSMRFQENLVKWQAELDQQKDARQEEKKRIRDELKQQIEEKKMNTLERRKADLQLDKELEEYDNKQEAIELERLAEERRKRIAYYEELNEIASEKKDAVDAVVSELEEELKALREKRSTEDTCNENYKRQQEQNLDLLNANAEEFSKNKTKVLGSQLTSLMDEQLVVDVPKAATSTTDNLTDAQRNKLKILSEEFDLKNYENCDNKEQAIVEMGKRILTDAQKNKLKVMRHEFNNNPEEGAEVVDEDQVVLIEKPQTELQKNKQKVMRHEFNNNPEEGTAVGVNPKVVIDQPQTDLQKNKLAVMSGKAVEFSEDQEVTEQAPKVDRPLTEMERNRLKVMSAEFAMDVPISSKLATEISEETMTELQKNRRKILFGDVTAGSEVHCDKGLQLNLTERRKNKEKFFRSELGQQLAAPSNNAVALTPMSTTSDPDLDVEDQGHKLEVEEKIPEEEHQMESTKESGEIEAHEEQEDRPIQPMTTFMDFVKPLMNLSGSNVFEEAPQRSLDDTEEQDDANCPIQRELKRSDLRKLSLLNFETFNQLLQQSLTIPLKTQLELMNNEILKMYLLDLDIYSHFVSLRNYFFLMDGEFGIHICESLISAVEGGVSPKTLYSFNLLNSTLEQAFGASVSGKDKNGSRLAFAMVKHVAVQDFDLLSPNVLEDIDLMYQLEWPLNLILCPKTVTQYSTIFRYLLKVRRISWVLESSSYTSLKNSAKTLSRDLLTSPQYRHVQLIRHKFSQFVQCLKNHITSSAVQSSWKRFKDDLLGVTSMAQLYSVHTSYIKQVKFLCMLNKSSQEFQNRLNDIFTIILRFNNHLNGVEESLRWQQIQRSSAGLAVDAGKSKKKAQQSIFVHPNYAQMCKDEEDFDKCCNYVMYLGGKIVRRGYQVELNEFLNLVNINGFYKGLSHEVPQCSGNSSASLLLLAADEEDGMG